MLWVRVFDTVEELYVARLQFKQGYNPEWLGERHGHQTPAAVQARFAIDAGKVNVTSQSPSLHQTGRG